MYTGIFWVIKTEGNRQLGRSRLRWEENIRMDLRETKLGGMKWIHLAQGPGVGCCEHGNKYSSSIKFWEILE
jgi:hypothetical protein